MLGVYDYTVVLTYVSLMVSIGGMMFGENLEELKENGFYEKCCC